MSKQINRELITRHWDSVAKEDLYKHVGDIRHTLTLDDVVNCESLNYSLIFHVQVVQASKSLAHFQVVSFVRSL